MTNPSEANLDKWPCGVPKRKAFEIALSGGRREARIGYVLGDFAVHAPAKGEYFWTLTHLWSGCRVTVSPPPDGKAQALELLSAAAGGHLAEHIKDAIENAAALGWGAGL